MARATHVRKVYIGGGETKRSAFPGWETLRIECLAPEKDAEGNAVVVDTFDIAKAEVPADMKDCGLGHGLSQKFGDSLAGIDKKVNAEDSELPGWDSRRGFADAILQILTDQWEDLQNGIWVSEAEGGGGGNITILLQAVQAARANAGRPMSEEEVAEAKTKLADKDYAKKVKAHPKIAAEVARINQERAAERAAAAAKKAEEAGDDAAGFEGLGL